MLGVGVDLVFARGYGVHLRQGAYESWSPPCRQIPATDKAPPGARSDASMSSSRHLVSVLEESVQVAGEVPLEAADRLGRALAFMEAPLDVGDRRGM